MMRLQSIWIISWFCGGRVLFLSSFFLLFFFLLVVGAWVLDGAFLGGGVWEM